MTADCQPGVRRGGLNLPWRTLLLASLAVGLYLLLGAAPQAWVFDRSAIAKGEWWRLLTGHWVHSDIHHALWDIGALLLMGFLFERQLGGRLFLLLLFGSAAIDAWIWWVEPSLAYYCGLSGILNTLMVVGLWQLWREQCHILIAFTGLAYAGKVVAELVAGQALITHTAWPAVPEVHVMGMVCGMLYTLGIAIADQSKARHENTDTHRDTAATRFPGTGGRQPGSRGHSGVSGICRIR